MFAVEYYNTFDNTSTYNIFTKLKLAQAFCDKTVWNKNYFPLYIFKADFNKERIYRENEEWNYEDCSDTILKYYNFRIELR